MAYTRITLQEYNDRVSATPEDRLSEVNGVSPGGVAARLGITRQAVHNAIKRDTLDAFKITHGGRTVAIIVPDAEVSRYRRQHLRKVS